MREAQLLGNENPQFRVDNHSLKDSRSPEFTSNPAISEFQRIMEKSLSDKLGISPPDKDIAEELVVNVEAGKLAVVAVPNTPDVNQNNNPESKFAVEENLAVSEASVEENIEPDLMDGLDVIGKQMADQSLTDNLQKLFDDPEIGGGNALNPGFDDSEIMDIIPRIQSMVEEGQNNTTGLEALAQNITKETAHNAVTDPSVEDINWHSFVKNDRIDELSSLKHKENEVRDSLQMPRFGSVKIDKLARLDDRDNRIRELFLSELNLKDFWDSIHKRFSNVNFISGNQKNSSENMEKELRNDLSNLAKSSFRLDTTSMNADLWVQQIWPLPQNDSIYNGNNGTDIPYNPERDTIQSSESEGIIEWEESFETDWAKAESGTGSPAGINSFKEEVPENQEIVSNKTIESPFKSVPEGERLFNDIMKQMTWNIDNGNYKMSLALHPENLGHLRMNVSLQGDKLNARILVENESVKKIMDSKLSELVEKLNLNGISVKNIEIAVNGEEPLSGPMTAVNRSYRPSYESMVESSPDNRQVAYFNRKNESLSNNWVV